MKKTILKFSAKAFHKLPFSAWFQRKIQDYLYSYFPIIFCNTMSYSLWFNRMDNSSILSTGENLNENINIPVSDNYEFSVVDSPKVSIIIPVYGQVEYTSHCLRSVFEARGNYQFEIIVVNDCSKDNTIDVVELIKGVRLINNEENLGFILSCNRGAEVAKGEYLLFLNNDTQVNNGWLDSLVETFNDFPGTGLVGSKLIYPNGKLQEAGGIIWNDGSAWNYGRGQNADSPEFNYAREVDYCSGAAIMVPKGLFEEFGGFDEKYLPAYCEDADLALKIRNKGLRVIYQPMSTVIHYEGMTSGTDTSKGIKAYQVENSKKLFERWKGYLQVYQNPGVDVDDAKDRRATRRALVLDHCTPTPNQDAGSVTIFNLMLLLREMDFQVTFIPEDNFLYMPEYTTALQRAGVEVLYAPHITSVEQHLKICGDRYNLALLFRPVVVERQIKSIRKYCPKAKVLFHTVDLHFLRMTREADLESSQTKQKAAEEMKKREFAAIRAVDASIVHSTAEYELLHPKLPDEKLHVFPLILDIEETSKTFSDRRDIIFVGGYQHTPNIDAVLYFVTEIMPLLRKRVPGVHFYVVGSNPPDKIQALACEDIIITGFVEELSPILEKMRVSIAPLRYGAGIKGKIGTAMAAGLPVVATSLAAEGMSLTDGENVMVADGCDLFTDALVAVYKDETLWNNLSKNSLNFAKQAWGAEAAWEVMNDILLDLNIVTKDHEYPLSLFSSKEKERKKKHKTYELIPIASVQNKKEFDLLFESESLKQMKVYENELLQSSKSESFKVEGYCVPCNKKVLFLVDMLSGGQRFENGWIPNWRERLECPICAMNNRQRLMATLIKQELNKGSVKNVYFMEQVTPIYVWSAATFKKHKLIGSEYLGFEYDGGEVIKGIRHEDIESLSFTDNSLDLIISNDVFEHVPHPKVAFKECTRVLKDGGVMLATIPFHSSNDLSIVRAKIVGDELEHLLSPYYHGNPISSEGSLVFTDFGWDMLAEMRDSGFTNVAAQVYADIDYGHLGGGQIVFKCVKNTEGILL